MDLSGNVLKMDKKRLGTFFLKKKSRKRGENRKGTNKKEHSKKK